jgi:hypothetical protein
MSVGPAWGTDGTAGPGGLNSPGVRFAKDGGQVVNQSHGKYFEATSRGNTYCATVGVGGVAPGTSIGTTAAFILYNPASSGKRLVVQKASVGYISGTLGAGTLFFAYRNSQTVGNAPSGGTALTPVNCDQGGFGNSSVAVPRSGGSLDASPTILRPFAILDAALATSVVGARQIVEDLDGEFVVEPGVSLVIEGVAAAGTSPLIVIGMTWEEIPIL